MSEGLIQVARAVGEAALAVDGVHSLGTGTFAEAATYEAGEKFSGVVVRDDEVEIHVVLGFPLVEPIPKLAESIEQKATPLAGDRRINVVVQDLVEADDEAKDGEVEQ